MFQEAVGNFTKSLSAISDARLRLLLQLSALILVFFTVNFARIFLPGQLVAGEDLQDYAAFYGAAQFALSGAGGNLYDPAVFQEAIGAQTTLLWLYPPPMLFLLAPFALVPYGAAKIFWVITTLACAYGVGRLALGNVAGGALSVIGPASFATLYVGQASAFFGLLLVAGLLAADKRPILAGACFALLTLKPQYGLLVIPFLLAVKAWKAMAAAAAFSLLMIAVSAAVFGVDMWRDFFDSLINGVHAAYYQSGGHPGRITLSDAIKAMGLGAPPAWAIYIPLFALVVAGMIVLAKRAPRALLVAYTLAGSALLCPYFFVYDFFLYGAAVLIVAAHLGALPRHASYAFGALWFAPLAPFLGGSVATPAFVWPICAFGTLVIFRLAQGEPATKHARA